jgi:hypothetical protein
MNNNTTKQIEEALESNQLLNELNVTLVELNKAIENCSYMYQTAHTLGLFDLAKQKKNVNLQSIIRLLKNIDYNQLLMILQSPLIQQILSDPEFFQLFAPDTDPTPSTSSDAGVEQQDM